MPPGAMPRARPLDTGAKMSAAARPPTHPRPLVGASSRRREGMAMGPTAIAAGLLFGLAIVMLALFFRTQDARFDRVAEWSFVAFGVTGVLTVLAVSGRIGVGGGGALGAVATILGVAGAAVVGLVELGTTLRLVDFRRVAPLITMAFFAFLAWIGLASLSFVTGGAPSLPMALGWLGVASILVGALVVASIVRVPGVITGQVDPPNTAMTAFFVPMAGIIAWLAWLGLVL